ncbi:MAG: 16S rRNA (cytidine(1402)-2'-O)-methyltransferase [Deltaproteobacteria bacterium]|nr:16S rRNA (cytidine(1402)-2'-O)-methyltransferase [Deltaproteobacteria bacterium]
MSDKGQLYIVATPIGNLEDITFRALRVLKEVDVIACEDTRHTRKLLTHFQISKPLISYYQQNQMARTEEIMNRVHQGEKVALVCDAGTPGISDPGSYLIQSAIQNEVDVVPIPGPCAAITALMAAGLPTDRFFFYGFLPIKSGKRRKILEALSTLETTLVFYEAGNRLSRMLQDLNESLGNRRIVIARELTKFYEEFKRGEIETLIPSIPREGLKGECVILVNLRIMGEGTHEKEES